MAAKGYLLLDLTLLALQIGVQILELTLTAQALAIRKRRRILVILLYLCAQVICQALQLIIALAKLRFNFGLSGLGCVRTVQDTFNIDIANLGLCLCCRHGNQTVYPQQGGKDKGSVTAYYVLSYSC